jgi:hypothetical protein
MRNNRSLNGVVRNMNEWWWIEGVKNKHERRNANAKSKNERLRNEILSPWQRLWEKRRID